MKEDTQEEGVIVKKIARYPIKTKSQLTREAKEQITRGKKESIGIVKGLCINR